MHFLSLALPDTFSTPVLLSTPPLSSLFVLVDPSTSIRALFRAKAPVPRKNAAVLPLKYPSEVAFPQISSKRRKKAYSHKPNTAPYDTHPKRHCIFGALIPPHRTPHALFCTSERKTPLSPIPPLPLPPLPPFPPFVAWLLLPPSASARHQYQYRCRRHYHRFHR